MVDKYGNMHNAGTGNKLFDVIVADWYKPNRTIFEDGGVILDELNACGPVEFDGDITLHHTGGFVK